MFAGFSNFGTIRVAGIDYDLEYGFANSAGDWTIQANVTHTFQYDLALQPGLASTSRVSRAFVDGNWVPRWKGSLNLGWSHGPFSASATARYIGGYRDYQPLLNGTYRQLGKFAFLDANVRIALGELLNANGPLLQGTYLDVGGVNIGNRLPRFANNGLYGWDYNQEDIRGRFLCPHRHPVVGSGTRIGSPSLHRIRCEMMSLRAAIVATISLSIAAPVSLPAQEAPSRASRPYTVEDHDRREAVVAVALSPNGRFIAVERERGTGRSETYPAFAPLRGDWNSRRSDLLVLDAASGAIIWQSPRTGGVSHFGATWSPDGDTLAYLRADREGVSHLAFLRPATGQLLEIPSIDVDLSVLVSGPTSSASQSYSGVPESHVAWTSGTRVLVVGQERPNGRPLGPQRLPALEQRWRTTWDGGVSRRVWDSRRIESCNRGGTLYAVDAQTLGVERLFTGDVTAVAAAPGGRRVAVVQFNRSIVRPSSAPLEVPESPRIGGRNDLQGWDVVVLDGQTRAIRSLNVGSGTGTVSEMTAPRWSADGSRLAFVTGNLPSADRQPEAMLFDMREHRLERRGVASVAAADATAGLYVSTGRVEEADGQVAAADRGRRARVSARTYYSLGGARTLYGDAQGIRLADAAGSREIAPGLSLLAVAGGDTGQPLLLATRGDAFVAGPLDRPARYRIRLRGLLGFSLFVKSDSRLSFGGSHGCIGPAHFTRRPVGADIAAHHW